MAGSGLRPAVRVRVLCHWSPASAAFGALVTLPELVHRSIWPQERSEGAAAPLLKPIELLRHFAV